MFLQILFCLLVQVLASPSDLECADDDTTRVQSGKIIMSMYTSPFLTSDGGAKFIFTDKATGKVVTNYSVGQEIVVNVTDLSDAAFPTKSVLRAGGNVGNFTDLGPNMAKKCDTQIYTIGLAKNTWSSGVWVADAEYGDVTFATVWSDGPVSLKGNRANLFFNSAVLSGPSAPVPPTPVPTSCSCCTQTCTLALGDDFTLTWQIKNDNAVISVTAKRRTWISFGFAPKSAMVGSEAVVYKPAETKNQVGLYDLVKASFDGVIPYSDDSYSTTRFFGEQGNTSTTLSFTRSLSSKLAPIDLTQSSAVIYAAGATNDFTDAGHVLAGVINVHWAQGTATTGGLDKTFVAVHAFLMVLAWGLLLPIGIYSARYGDRKNSTTWFQVHRACQLLGATLNIIAFALIVSAYHSAGKTNFDILHAKVGLAVFIGALFNPLLAVVRPAAEPKTYIRLLWEILHSRIGYAVLILAWVNCVTGVQLQFMSDKLTTVQSVVSIVFYVSLALSILLFLQGELKKVQKLGKALNGDFNEPLFSGTQ